jgi:hypothetical protein
MVAISLLCLPLGIYFFVDNSRLTEFSFDYSQCINADTWTTSPLDSSVKWIYSNASRNCTIRFPINSKLSKVRFYIKLTNFFQNHRLYIASLNAPQLQGRIIQTSDLDSASAKTSCSWLAYANCDQAAKFKWDEGNGLTYAQNNPDCFPDAANRDEVIKNAALDAQYYPCGLVENSFFSGI